MKVKGKFDIDTYLGKELQEWWEELHGKGVYEGKPRTGDRAELKKAKTVLDVILLPAFQKSCPRFKPLFKDEQDWMQSIDRLAAILGLLAHVKNLSEKKLALDMASPDIKKQEPPVVSELRFRRLIQRDRDDLYEAMIRILRTLGNEANLHDLANSVYYWDDKVKRRWAFDYFPNTPEKASA